MKHFFFEDHQYPKRPLTRNRKIVRAILLDKDGRFIFEQLHRDDLFGNETYIETPGGGKELGESDEECLKREIKEELGYEIEILKPIATVEDAYHLIETKNHQVYYLAKVIEKRDSSMLPDEKIRFIGELHLSLKAAIATMEQHQGGVGKLVAQREIAVLKEVEEENEHWNH